MRKCRKMNKGIFSKRNIGYWKGTDGRVRSTLAYLSCFDYGVILKARRGVLPWVTE